METLEKALAYYGTTLEQVEKEAGLYGSDAARFIVELYEDDTAPVRG